MEAKAMPIICELWGLGIYMYYREHLPPHLHVRGPGVHAIFLIPDGILLAGKLPSGTVPRIAAWVRDDAELLMEDWRRAHRKEPLLRVPAPK
jgi:hypothetical protein